ncbi:DMT family transporter [Pseudoxanthomonas sp. JBR18]|uniref:DMT family transporter n=1 Tax=Pseudoxanthomonas sp. JBR18 TaxID=2969308 RepID=UPI0023050102|nr:DMT family transporter [Pseudoxanthomonas sp. JBR18]WCE02656.1 DMT family transporter [Pseudoxanthomonas sp. JBR18]
MDSHAPPWRAAGLMLCAVALFAVMDVGLKLLAARHAPLQVAALRGASSLPLVLAWALVTVGPRALLRVRWPLHLLRGVLSIGMMAGFVYGVARMPLSTAYALTFAAPLLVTALAGPVLNEHVGPRRWTAIVLGLLGVLVVLRPTGAGLWTAAGAAVLGAAACYAASILTTRAMAPRESSQAMVVWLVAMMAVFAGVLAWADWTRLVRADLWPVIAIGISGALAQMALTEAFRHGEASRIAPLEYSALIWGVLADLLLWRQLPDAVTWLGVGIIVTSGLYLLRRERRVAADGQVHP